LSSSSSSKIKFGIVIPQGWSYSVILPFIEQQQDDKAKEHDGEDTVEQYNFSRRIAEAADKSAFAIYHDHHQMYNSFVSVI
jgi:hypothetical protein